MRGEDKPYELPPLNSTDGACAAPAATVTTAHNALPAIPLGPPPAVVSLAQGRRFGS